MYNSRQEINKSRARQIHPVSLFHSHPRPAKMFSYLFLSLSLSFLSLPMSLLPIKESSSWRSCCSRYRSLSNAINSHLISPSVHDQIVFEISRRVDQRDRRSRWMNDRDTKKYSLRQDESGIQDDGEHRVKDKMKL